MLNTVKITGLSENLGGIVGSLALTTPRGEANSQTSTLGEIDLSIREHLDLLIRQLANDKDATMTGKNGKQKAKDYAEVTTSIDLIDRQLALLPKEMFLDLSKTVLDPCTGDGRYLMRYLYYRLPVIKTADNLLQAISTLYGIELQAVNVARARNNLYLLTAKIAEYLGVGMDYDLVHKILNSNIRQGNFLDERTKTRPSKTKI